MVKEPGLYPTNALTVSLSHTIAAPGDQMSLTVDGRGAASLIRGKLIGFEKTHDGAWISVGSVMVASYLDGPSRWIPAGNPPLAMTMEGYGAMGTIHFEVPPIPPGDYRIRLDAIAPADRDEDDLRRRTATLYASLRVEPDAKP